MAFATFVADRAGFWPVLRNGPYIDDAIPLMMRSLVY